MNGTRGTAIHDLKGERARFSFQEVARWPDGTQRTKLTTRLQGLAVQVHTEGLLVTLAAMMAGDSDDSRLANALSRWLLRESPLRALFDPATAAEAGPRLLLERAAGAGRSDYAALQTETVAFFDMMKLFATALDKSAKHEKGGAG